MQFEQASLQAAGAHAGSRFSTVRFMTAAEKEKVLQQWTRLMHWLAANGVPAEMPKLFTKVIYDHLQLHATGYIAHYDQRGFWAAQLGTPAAATEFFRELHEHLLPRWGALVDYADINDAMMAVAHQVRPTIFQGLSIAEQASARAQILALASRAGISLGKEGQVGSDVGIVVGRAALGAGVAESVPASAPLVATPASPQHEQASLF